MYGKEELDFQDKPPTKADLDLQNKASLIAWIIFVVIAILSAIVWT
jgi:hypothetical protein